MNAYKELQYQKKQTIKLKKEVILKTKSSLFIFILLFTNIGFAKDFPHLPELKSQVDSHIHFVSSRYYLDRLRTYRPKNTSLSNKERRKVSREIKLTAKALCTFKTGASDLVPSEVTIREAYDTFIDLLRTAFKMQDEAKYTEEDLYAKLIEVINTYGNDMFCQDVVDNGLNFLAHFASYESGPLAGIVFDHLILPNILPTGETKTKTAATGIDLNKVYNLYQFDEENDRMAKDKDGNPTGIHPSGYYTFKDMLIYFLDKETVREFNKQQVAKDKANPTYDFFEFDAVNEAAKIRLNKLLQAYPFMKTYKELQAEKSNKK